MWVEEADNFAEFFRGYVPLYLILVLPLFLIISPAAASHEFNVHRMQHYDLHGVHHGCRSAPVNLEARSLSGWGTSRHCVVARLQELSVDQFQNIRLKAGALLIILPNDIASLSAENKQHLMILEDAMLAQDISIPVYFAEWSHELDTIVSDISHSFITDDKAGSAAEAMLTSVSANGYQIVINAGNANAKQEIKVATVHGRLSGRVSEGKVPTITVVAHYDSFGIAPELAFGADSNGSGVAMLLELLRLFSTLYADKKMHGKYNIVFILTGGGKINYQGSKKWLEDQLDSPEGSIIQDSSYVMCLDTLASSDSIYMHVSKPPKDGSPSALFYKELKTAADRYPSHIVDGVHKKINLADDLLAWEHERYSMRRLPAFTLSSLKSHRDSKRSTILDTKETLNFERLVRNTQMVSEALASYIYNSSSGNVLGSIGRVNENSLKMWIDYLGSQPRSTQLLCNKDNLLVNTLKDVMSRYLKDVKVSYVVPDKRDPDFLFYDVTRAIVNVYSVKPAVFDLVLTFAIILYLGAIYLLLQRFPAIYQTICKLTASNEKSKLQ